MTLTVVMLFFSVNTFVKIQYTNSSMQFIVGSAMYVLEELTSTSLHISNSCSCF